MVSHALSRRRSHIARPIVCKKKPPLPVVEPPPPAWPPDSFTVQVEYTWEDIDGVHDEDYEIELTRIGEEDWIWQGVDTPPLRSDAGLSISVAQQDATHSLNYWLPPPGESHADVYNLPITWDIPTIYVIEAWDLFTGGWLTLKSSFTF